VWDRELSRKVRASLAEDIGGGDVTTRLTVTRGRRGRGVLIAKARGVFCGAPVAERVFRLADRRTRVEWLVGEGERVRPGQVVARLSGPYAALLAAERVALNFLQRLSGIATLTRRMVDAAGGEGGPAICDTRKTTPLWRKLERYAVRAGGGANHRFGLFDMVLIKENHARAAGGIGAAIERARRGARRLKIAAEARDGAEAARAVAAGADLILLDNVTPARARAIVRRHRGSGAVFEVSGGVNAKNAAAYARAGVDRISVGALTHSAPALDLSLQLYPAPEGRT
jgi:nicotinate-nucleotide pyrophosphorylase (carboxylating)